MHSISTYILLELIAISAEAFVHDPLISWRLLRTIDPPSDVTQPATVENAAAKDVTSTNSHGNNSTDIALSNGHHATSITNNTLTATSNTNPSTVANGGRAQRGVTPITSTAIGSHYSSSDGIGMHDDHTCLPEERMMMAASGAANVGGTTHMCTFT
jgi:hypothetical protein